MHIPTIDSTSESAAWNSSYLSHVGQVFFEDSINYAAHECWCASCCWTAVLAAVSAVVPPGSACLDAGVRKPDAAAHLHSLPSGSC